MSEKYRETRISRKSPIRLYPFRQFFQGFENAPPVQELFGKRTEKVLRDQKVEFFSPPFGYMGTSDEDGHLIISSHHLKTSDLRTLYLDIVHELCHVKQHMAGRPLFDRKRSYVDTPTEVEAYRFTVKEGRRLGMTDAELFEYLKVEWIDAKELRRLARNSGVKVPAPRKSRRGRPHRARRSR